jgi:hypothetical protein
MSVRVLGKKGGGFLHDVREMEARPQCHDTVDPP